MRVLISSSAGYGHILPMVPLGRALLAAGHDVLWATPPEGLPLVSAAGFATTTAGLARSEIQAAWEPFADAVEQLPPQERPAHMFPKLFGAIRAPRMAEDLLRAARQWGPDLLVHEQGEFAAPLVAAVLGLPSVVHAFGVVVPPEQVAGVGREVAPLWAAHGREVPPYAGCYESLYLDIYPRSMQLGSTAHIRDIQPLRPVPYTGEDTGLPPLPAGDAPVVYLTLGTVFNPAHVLSTALTALSAMDVRVVATVGPTGDPAAVGPQPPQVLVERYVSQTALLPHCAAVVSHAGSGTTLAAMSCGLPHVCLPQGADQFRNAAAVEAVGAGVSISPEACTPEAVADAVSGVLTSSAYRAAAGRVSAEIGAMPAPEAAVERLERVAAG